MAGRRADVLKRPQEGVPEGREEGEESATTRGGCEEGPQREEEEEEDALSSPERDQLAPSSRGRDQEAVGTTAKLMNTEHRRLHLEPELMNSMSLVRKQEVHRRYSGENILHGLQYTNNCLAFLFCLI